MMIERQEVRRQESELIDSIHSERERESLD